MDRRYRYQYGYTVEFDTVLQWTGDENLTLNGKTYSYGKIENVGDIPVSKDISQSTVNIRMSASTIADRTYYLGQDPGPKPCKVQLIWRKRLRVGGTWSAWTVGTTFDGKLSDGTYEDGSFEIRIQTVFGDVWRGEPRKLTASDQKRHFPTDTCFDRTDEFRENGNILLDWQA